MAMNINLCTPYVGFLIWHGTFFMEVFGNSYNNKLLPKPTFTGKLQIYLRLRVFNFFGHYCKGKVLIDIFCLESLFFVLIKK